MLSEKVELPSIQPRLIEALILNTVGIKWRTDRSSWEVIEGAKGKIFEGMIFAGRTSCFRKTLLSMIPSLDISELGPKRGCTAQGLFAHGL
jgi:hypothetical protein